MPYNNDIDPIETQEWLESLDTLIEEAGSERAQFILQQLLQRSSSYGIAQPVLQQILHADYVNTIPFQDQPNYPGDIEIEKRVLAYLRWNAVIMILKAGKYSSSLGGHIASYASAALLYEVGFQHIFHAANDHHGGDLIYIQGHSSPGIYARAFLEGRLAEPLLHRFRQEIRSKGLSSYPHPWLMPNFWQFATVSMGLGPLFSIYQARFLKYLANRHLANTANRKIWTFCGDGEMDEPESLGAITIAAREQLDNLIFVINCNLQRLDGPVRGNGSIVRELESIFMGAGWNVIKVLWNSAWDVLLENDHQGYLRKRMAEICDGEYQNYVTQGPKYFRKHFFGSCPELLAMVEHMSDEELTKLHRGGHDLEKIYAAYHKAIHTVGRPTVILAKTVKGYGMGNAGEAQNITHQKKKMTTDDLKSFCLRFDIPATDNDIEQLNFLCPSENSEEIQYIKARRAKLGGYLPQRRENCEHSLIAPSLTVFSSLLVSTDDRKISTTMAFVRILSTLLKDKELGPRIVPIIPDESRTFGMEGLFRQIGIYSPVGQCYQPEDAKQVMYYREAVDGQILEEGINEAGAFASWIAAGTSYSNNNLQMIPFYIYYSMFGFQRIGDLAWAAADMQTRGFLLGATAGRTTLAGEGLQHQDGHSHIMANTIPNCVSYDPAYSYEVAVIIQNGLQRMITNQENVFFYITLMNENYQHPAMPDGVEDGIVRGMYLLKKAKKEADKNLNIQLLGCGTILNEVIAAAEILSNDYKITADIWSVTSFNELRKDGLAVERYNRLNPQLTKEEKKIPYVTQCLNNFDGPVIAVTDYIKLFADQIRAFVPRTYAVLGTDGFGRSDTREELRYFFEVNAQMIAYIALQTLAEEGKLSFQTVHQAMSKLNIDMKKSSPFDH